MLTASYNNKGHSLLPLLPRLFTSLSHPPAHTVIVNNIPESLANTSDFVDGKHNGWTKVHKWDDWLPSTDVEPTFERMGFNEPIWILFSSGTTGRPKAIVHRQGGMLLDSLREHHLQGDITRGDVFFYYTTP